MAHEEHGQEAARFMAATYLSDVRCSYLPGFAQQVRDEIAKNASSVSDLLDILADATSETGCGRLLVDEADARRYVEARDLLAIRTRIMNEGLDEADFSGDSIHADVVETCVSAIAILRKHDVPVGSAPEVVVVDRMPEPYDRRQGIAALAIDTDDEVEFGIPQGVYFQRSMLTPYYSQFIALHEMLHVILGRLEPGRTAHGLEEGLADVLGSIWLSRLVLGGDLTKRLFVLNRLSSQYNPYWERYLDTARQAFSLILIHGLDRVLKHVQGGRSELYELERSLLEIPREPVRADLDDEFLRLAWELLFTYPRAFVCSPAALLFAEQARSGLTIREIAARAHLSPAIAADAARELHDEHGVLFLRNDELVVIEGTPATILAGGWFRYESG